MDTELWTASPAPPAPPRLLEAAEPLSAAQVKVMLAAPSLPGLLNLLGFGGGDVDDTHELVERALADQGVLRAVARAASALTARAGVSCPRVELESLPERDVRMLRERGIGTPGALPLLALLVGSSTVREFHARRGLSRDLSWDTLADLGSQVAVHRRVTGTFGLSTLPWVALNWVGRLYVVGRLQYELEPIPDAEDAEETGAAGAAPTHRVSIHIPRGGPLSGPAVDASLAAARTLFGTHFADLDLAPEWVCDSWLLSPQLAEVLPADSNLLAFQDRFDITAAGDGTDEMCFFVFDRPRGTPLTAGDIPALPRDTALRRGISNLLSTGERWQTGHGVLRTRS